MPKTYPMTITEKILASHANKKHVSPGDLIDARVDLALGNDITAPLAIQAFEEMGAKKVFHRDRVVLVSDHFTPAKDILSAEQCKVSETLPRPIISLIFLRPEKRGSSMLCSLKKDLSCRRSRDRGR